MINNIYLFFDIKKTTNMYLLKGMLLTHKAPPPKFRAGTR